VLKAFAAVSAELVAYARGAAVLPDNGVVNGFARLTIPDEGGFALVRDANGGDIAGFGTGFVHGFDSDAELRRPDLLRVVLDPAGIRIDLFNFLLRDGADAPGMIEDNRAGAGRSFIEGENVGHGRDVSE
jgi:hypothetical protein